MFQFRESEIWLLALKACNASGLAAIGLNGILHAGWPPDRLSSTHFKEKEKIS